MADIKESHTPLQVNTRLSRSEVPTTEEELKRMEEIPYASIIGSLMYAMITCRPDLAFPVGLLSRFMHCYSKRHWEVLKSVLKYVKATQNYGIVFGRRQEEFKAYMVEACFETFSLQSNEEINYAQKNKVDTPSLVGFCDSDFGGDIETRKSTTGLVFLFQNSCVVWRSQLQSIVTLSTTESELIALVESAKDGIWLSRLINFMGVEVGPTVLYCDNLSSIAVAKHPMHYSRTKHVDIKYHKIREWIKEGVVELRKIQSLCFPADLMTKPLLKEPHYKHVKSLGVWSEEEAFEA